MSRRSERLDKNVSKKSIVFKTLLTILDSAHKTNGIKHKLKKTLEIIEYVINNFYNLKQSYIDLKELGLNSFSKLIIIVYEKIQELIVVSENLLLRGEKIKNSIKKLLYYNIIYSKIYFDYEEKQLLENRSQKIIQIINKKKIEYDKRSLEIKKICKHIFINKLPFCNDVINIIKSYCFYDKKTFEQIKMVKNLKLTIVNLFKNALFSRKNGNFNNNENVEYPNEDSDESQHWSFCINLNENQFQGVSCKLCGNYLEEYSENWVPHHILCNC
jgi:hypothetical protein